MKVGEDLGVWEKTKAFFTRSSSKLLSGTENPERWLVDAVGGNSTKTGIYVNEETALKFSAVFACVRILAESVASLPLPVYKRLKVGRERAIDHPLYSLLHDQPNGEMTSYSFREVLMVHLLLWGNAYCEIERDNFGRIIGLWPLLPNKTWPERDDSTRQIVYKTISSDGKMITLSSDKVLHIPGLGFNGLIGFSPIRMAMQEAIGLGLAAEEFGADFYANGAHMGGIIEYPAKISKDGRERFETSVRDKYGGLGKAHKLMVLEEGLKFHDVTIPQNEAQFIESRKFQLEEIARMYRVPLHMIQNLDRSTNNNIEHQSLEFVVHTLRPWLVRWEQAISWKLLNPQEKRRYFAKFTVDGLLRGDIKSRYEAYAVGRQNGWLCADDIRELEDMNPLPDDQGKIFLINGNMVPVDLVGGLAQARISKPDNNLLPAQDEDPEDIKKKNDQRSTEIRTAGASVRAALAESHSVIIADAVARIMKREEADVMRAARKMLSARSREDFYEWIQSFYKDHEEYVRKNIEPLFASSAIAIQAAAASEVDLETDITAEINKLTQEYLDLFIHRQVGGSQAAIRQAITQADVDNADPLDALQETFNAWQTERAQEVGQEEGYRFGNAIAMGVFIGAGIKYVRTVTSSKACDFCRSLAMQPIEINTPFCTREARGIKKHPPFHKGCRCLLMPQIDSGGNGTLNIIKKYPEQKRIVVNWHRIPPEVPQEYLGTRIIDKLDEKGQNHSRRYYGEDGKAVLDIQNTDHNMPKHHHKPHAHDWDGNSPSEWRYLTDKEKEDNEEFLKG